MKLLQLVWMYINPGLALQWYLGFFQKPKKSVLFANKNSWCFFVHSPFSPEKPLQNSTKNNTHLSDPRRLGDGLSWRWCVDGRYPAPPGDVTKPIEKPANNEINYLSTGAGFCSIHSMGKNFITVADLMISLDSSHKLESKCLFLDQPLTSWLNPLSLWSQNVGGFCFFDFSFVGYFTTLGIFRMHNTHLCRLRFFPKKIRIKFIRPKSRFHSPRGKGRRVHWTILRNLYSANA